MEEYKYTNDGKDKDIVELLINNFQKMLTYICDGDRVDITALQRTGFDETGQAVTVFDLSMYVKEGVKHGTTKAE